MQKNNSLLYKFLLLGTAVLAIFIRLYNIASWPNGTNDDIALKAVDAYNVSMGHWHMFYPFGGREGFFINLIGMFFKIFGVGTIQFHLPSIIVNLLTLVVFYFIMKKIVANKWVVLLTLFLLSINPWVLGITRTGFRSIMIPLITGLLFYLIIKLSDVENTAKRYFLVALMAVLIALGFNSYLNFIFFIPVFLYMLLFYKENFHKNEIIFGISLTIFLLGLLAVGYYYSDFNLDRIKVQAAWNLSNPIPLWAELSLRLFSFFEALMLYRPTKFIEGFGGFPILNPAFFLFFILNILANKNVKKYLPFLVWIFFGTLPVVLSGFDFNLIRATLLVIPIFAVIGMSINDLLVNEKTKKYKTAIIALLVVSVLWQLIYPIYLYSPYYQKDYKIRDDYYYHRLYLKDVIEITVGKYKTNVLDIYARTQKEYPVKVQFKWWTLIEHRSMENIKIIYMKKNTETIGNVLDGNPEVIYFFYLPPYTPVQTSFITSYFKPDENLTTRKNGTTWLQEKNSLTNQIYKQINSSGETYVHLKFRNKYKIVIEFFVKPQLLQKLPADLHRYGYSMFYKKIVE